MEPNQNLDEQISALVDGECTEPELGYVMSALRKPEHRLIWEVYHRIGDLIREREPGHDALSPLLLNSDTFNERSDHHTDHGAYQRTQYLGARKKCHLAGLHLARYDHKLNLSVIALLACLTVLVPQLAGREGVEISAAEFFAASFFSAASKSDKGFQTNIAGLQNGGRAESLALFNDSNEVWMHGISANAKDAVVFDTPAAEAASSPTWFSDGVRVE